MALLDNFRVCNGQDRFPALFPYFDVYRVLTVEEILDEIHYFQKILKKKMTALPVAECGTGDKIWLSFGHDEGPLRSRSHDDPAVPLVAPGYGQFLADFASDLQKNRFVVNREGGGHISSKRAFPPYGDACLQVKRLGSECVKEGLAFEEFRKRVFKLFDQPDWYVSYRISDYVMKSAFENSA